MELIIKIRLEALKNNLFKIQGILELVKARQEEIKTLNKNLTQAQRNTFEVKSNVEYVLNTSRNRFSDAKVDARLERILEIALTNINELYQSLENAEKSIIAVQTRSTRIEQTFETTVKNDLYQKMRPWLDTINGHLKSLGNVKPEDVDQLSEKAWDDYTDIMAKASELIFSEYVEFLGGLALRDAGLDEGICRIADELMRSCGSVGITQWSALTIPASKEASTLARSIRMGFPEWTIWAVPLTAHELGQVVIREPGNPDLEEYVRSQFPKKARTKQQHLRVFLADAFATYVMGPAYACSVILLRFNPRGNDQGKQDKGIYPADAKRAYVVLSMLTKMYEKDLLTPPPYGDILEKLKTAWDTALGKKQTEPLDTPSDDEKLLDGWADHLLEELGKAYAGGLYEGKLWKSTREALELLLKGKDEDAKDKLEGREEWRDVLNAAWACRVNNVDEALKIAKKAEELWRQIVRKKSETQERRVTPSGFAANIVPRIQADKKS